MNFNENFKGKEIQVIECCINILSGDESFTGLGTWHNGGELVLHESGGPEFNSKHHMAS